MVHPEGHFINTFRKKSKALQALLKARAEIKYLKSVHGNAPVKPPEAGMMPVPLQRQSTGLKQMKLVASKMSEKTYERKLKAAEAKLKKITERKNKTMMIRCMTRTKSRTTSQRSSTTWTKSIR